VCPSDLRVAETRWISKFPWLSKRCGYVSLRNAFPQSRSCGNVMYMRVSRNGYLNFRLRIFMFPLNNPYFQLFHHVRIETFRWRMFVVLGNWRRTVCVRMERKHKANTLNHFKNNISVYRLVYLTWFMRQRCRYFQLKEFYAGSLLVTQSSDGVIFCFLSTV